MATSAPPRSRPAALPGPESLPSFLEQFEQGYRPPREAPPPLPELPPEVMPAPAPPPRSIVGQVKAFVGGMPQAVGSALSAPFRSDATPARPEVPPAGDEGVLGRALERITTGQREALKGQQAVVEHTPGLREFSRAYQDLLSGTIGTLGGVVQTPALLEALFGTPTVDKEELARQRANWYESGGPFPTEPVQTGLAGASQSAAEQLQKVAKGLQPPDPGFVDKLMQGIGSTGPLILPGVGAASLAMRVFGFSPRAASWIGATAAAVPETLVEGTQTYQALLDKGLPKQEAAGTAKWVMAANAVLLPLTNRLGLPGDRGRWGRQLIMSAMMEGGQEGAQGVIQRLGVEGGLKAEDAWDIGQEFLVGATIGTLFKGAQLGGQRIREGRATPEPEPSPTLEGEPVPPFAGQLALPETTAIPQPAIPSRLALPETTMIPQPASPLDRPMELRPDEAIQALEALFPGAAEPLPPLPPAAIRGEEALATPEERLITGGPAPLPLPPSATTRANELMPAEEDFIAGGPVLPPQPIVAPEELPLPPGEGEVSEVPVGRVRRNNRRQGVELKFSTRPPDAVRKQLHAGGFKWNRAKQLWYAPQTPENEALARRLVEEAQVPEMPVAPEVQTPIVEEPQIPTLPTGEVSTDLVPRPEMPGPEQAPPTPPVVEAVAAPPMEEALPEPDIALTQQAPAPEPVPEPVVEPALTLTGQLQGMSDEDIAALLEAEVPPAAAPTPEVLTAQAIQLKIMDLKQRIRGVENGLRTLVTDRNRAAREGNQIRVETANPEITRLTVVLNTMREDMIDLDQQFLEAINREVPGIRQAAAAQELPPPAEPTPAPPAPPGAIPEAFQGLEETFRGLTELFGLGEGGLKSFPGIQINEATYQRALPHFRQAALHFENTGRSVAEFVRQAYTTFGTNIRPYLQRFLQDLRDGTVSLTTEPIPETTEVSPEPVGAPSEAALEGEPAADVLPPEAPGEAGPEPVSSAGTDEGRDGGLVEPGSALPSGVGTAEAGVAVPSRRGRSPRAGGRSRTTSRPAPDPDRTNYSLADPDSLSQRTPRQQFQDNVAALTILHTLRTDGRPATAAEQNALARYTGWGALKPAFERYGSMSQEFQQLRQLVTDGILTEDEYQAMSRSQLNANYTNPEVITQVWSLVKRLGFKGGRTLEPGMGTGLFYQLRPMDLKLQMSGVEMEPMAGRIAQQLFQSANIQVSSYQDANLPESFFDVVIGNVPFSDTKYYDRKYNPGRSLSLHNYFIYKSLALTRPGGIVSVLTSHYTMDATNPGARAKFFESADLVGAIRLPKGTFRSFSGTDVTTDLLVLRKRLANETPGHQAWLETSQVPMDPAWSGAEPQGTLNNYFVAHPEHLLGTMQMDRGLGGRPETQLAPAPDTPLAISLTAAIQSFPRNIMSREAPQASRPPALTQEIDAPETVRNFAFVLENGELMQRQGHVLIPTNLGAIPTARLIGMLPIRDQARELIYAQQRPDLSDQELQRLQQELSTTYDAFVEAYGPINSRANRRLILDDPDAALLLALEEYDQATDTATKTSIFTERTARRYVPPVHVDTPIEALTVTLNEQGFVDFDRMSALTGMSEPDLQRDLAGHIFETPASEWVTAEEYLSGNVREKLRQAQAAAEIEPQRYQGNVEALQQVQPPMLHADQIYAPINAAWVPHDYIQNFLAGLLRADPADISVQYIPEAWSWSIRYAHDRAKTLYDRTAASTDQWGTTDFPLMKLVDRLMNHGSLRVTDRDAQGKTVTDDVETAAVAQKVNDLTREWQRWLWDDPQRRETLLTQYNDRYNALVPRQYDGTHLQLPGMNPLIFQQLYPHQRNAIWRVVNSRNTLLAHRVGSGKTFTMIAAGMEMKRLGRVQKPLYVVMNHMLEQFSSDFATLYPGARVLVADQHNFDAKNRAQFMAKVATGNWDAVIIKHASLNKLAIRPETVRDFVQVQVNALRQTLQDARDEGDRIRTREIEKVLEKREEKLKEATEQVGKDLGLTFEDLGVDFLFLDESQEFKNLDITTKLGNIGGLGDRAGSNKAFDLLMKIQYLRQLNNGGGVVFATGTPISNTMAEFHHLMRYLQQDALVDLGMVNFDEWADTFTIIEEGFEVNSTGTGFQKSKTLSKFSNLPELRLIWSEVADIQTEKMLEEADILVPGKNLPHLEGSKWQVVEVPSTDRLVNYMQTLVARLESWKASAPQNRNPADNPLAITSAAKKASIDMRLIDPNASVDAASKIQPLVDRVTDIYQRTRDRKSTQVIFYDLSRPDPHAGFNVHEVIRSMLSERGIPKKEIAFIHEYESDERKQELFDAMNRGDMSVLIGSTGKMGAGTNIQRKLIALHHLDVPWRPSDLEQRNGRMVRPGNSNPTVAIYNYVGEKSFDARLWQIIERKARNFDALLAGDPNMRTSEDLAGRVMINSAAEAKAVAANNPLIMMDVNNQARLEQLGLVRTAHFRQQRDMGYELGQLPKQITSAEQRLTKAETDAAQWGTGYDPKNPEMIIEGQRVTGRENIDKALSPAVAAAIASAEANEFGTKGFMHTEPRHFGEIAGFPIDITIRKGFSAVWAELDINGQLSYRPGTESLQSIVQTMTQGGPHQVMRQEQQQIEQSIQRLADIQRLHGQVFPQEDAFIEASETQTIINRIKEGNGTPDDWARLRLTPPSPTAVADPHPEVNPQAEAVPLVMTPAPDMEQLESLERAPGDVYYRFMGVGEAPEIVQRARPVTLEAYPGLDVYMVRETGRSDPWVVREGITGAILSRGLNQDDLRSKLSDLLTNRTPENINQIILANVKRHGFTPRYRLRAIETRPQAGPGELPTLPVAGYDPSNPRPIDLGDVPRPAQPSTQVAGVQEVPTPEPGSSRGRHLVIEEPAPESTTPARERPAPAREWTRRHLVMDPEPTPPEPDPAEQPDPEPLKKGLGSILGDESGSVNVGAITDVITGAMSDMLNATRPKLWGLQNVAPDLYEAAHRHAAAIDHGKVVARGHFEAMKRLVPGRKAAKERYLLNFARYWNSEMGKGILRDPERAPNVRVNILEPDQEDALLDDPIFQKLVTYYRERVQPLMEEMAPAAGIHTFLETPSGFYGKLHVKKAEDDATDPDSIRSRLRETMPNRTVGYTSTGQIPRQLSRKRARAAMRASGSGVYSEDLQDMLEDMHIDRFTAAYKNELIDVVQRYKVPIPEGARRAPQETMFGGKQVPVVLSDVGTAKARALSRGLKGVPLEDIWLPKPVEEAWREVTVGSRLDELQVPVLSQLGNGLTTMMLIGPADAVIHGMNVFMALLNAPGMGRSLGMFGRAMSWTPAKFLSVMADVMNIPGSEMDRILPILSEYGGLRTSMFGETGKGLEAFFEKIGGPPGKWLGHQMLGLKRGVFDYPSYGRGIKGMESRARVALYKAMEAKYPDMLPAERVSRINNFLGTYMPGLQPDLIKILRMFGLGNPFAVATSTLMKTGTKGLAGIGPAGFSPEVLAMNWIGIPIALYLLSSLFDPEGDRREPWEQPGWDPLMLRVWRTATETTEIPLRFIFNNFHRGLRATGIGAVAKAIAAGEDDPGELTKIWLRNELNVMIGLANGPFGNFLFGAGAGVAPMITDRNALLPLEKPTEHFSLTERLKTGIKAAVPMGKDIIELTDSLMDPLETPKVEAARTWVDTFLDYLEGAAAVGGIRLKTRPPEREMASMPKRAEIGRTYEVAQAIGREVRRAPIEQRRELMQKLLQERIQPEHRPLAIKVIIRTIQGQTKAIGRYGGPLPALPPTGTEGPRTTLPAPPRTP